MGLNEAKREIMWNVGTYWPMYAMFFVAMIIFGYGVYRRVAFWKRGKPAHERVGDWGKRLGIVLKELVLQNRVRKSTFPGIFHSLIFYSFIVLVITTLVVAYDDHFGDRYEPHLFKGYVYVFLTVGSELAGVLILVGIGMAAWRRFKKPENLENQGWFDTYPLVLLGLLVVTGFLVEGLRIAVIGDPWWYLSLIGWVFSLPFKGLSTESGEAWHLSLWWGHTVLAMAWIAAIPYTKFFHLLSLPTNVLLSKLEPRGQLARFDIMKLLEAEDFDPETFSIGVTGADSFSWKDRVAFDSCIVCGRCDDVCPAVMVGDDFGPKRLIRTLLDECRRVDGLAASPAAEGQDKTIIGNGLDEMFVWYCRTCSACIEVCPAAIDHVGPLMEIRRSEVLMNSRLPGEAAHAMRTIGNLGNPFGPQSDRVAWMNELGVPIIGPGEKTDVLYWVGCCTVFDPAKHKIAGDLCKLLEHCKVDFGLLGADEQCCGDPARLLGDENTFQQIAKDQIEKLRAREFKTLLVSCPHCLNVLKNEYKTLGADFNVVHHSTFLHEMLQSGKIELGNGDAAKMVYHDPCYLGRCQNVYDAPRKVLESIPGQDLAEMADFRERSLCCGGGGGHYWMDLKSDERINNVRVEQADKAGADLIVTSCPYCAQMIDDSLKLKDLDERIRSADIASVLWRHVRSKEPAIEG
jgi:Fe-S oxidoreductase/nitrate reductase gamma subunit